MVQGRGEGGAKTANTYWYWQQFNALMHTFFLLVKNFLISILCWCFTYSIPFSSKSRPSRFPQGEVRHYLFYSPVPTLCSFTFHANGPWREKKGEGTRWVDNHNKCSSLKYEVYKLSAALFGSDVNSAIWYYCLVKHESKDKKRAAAASRAAASEFNSEKLSFIYLHTIE